VAARRGMVTIALHCPSDNSNERAHGRGAHGYEKGAIIPWPEPAGTM